MPAPRQVLHRHCFLASFSLSPRRRRKPQPPTSRSRPVITPEMIDQAGDHCRHWPLHRRAEADDDRWACRSERFHQGDPQTELPNSAQPAYAFHPLPAAKLEKKAESKEACKPDDEFARIELGGPLYSIPETPARIEDVAFATMRELGALLRNRKITSLALTQMYLARLKRYDSKLHFVITLTEERALAQAKQPMPRSPPANIAARCTAFPGAQKICWP